MTTGIRTFLAAITATLMLAACGVSLKPDPQAFEAAQKAYAQLTAGEDEALMASLPKETQNPTTLRTIGAMRQMLPEGQGGQAKLVGWQNYVGTGGNRATINMIYDYGDEHILATSQLLKAGEGWDLVNFFVRGATPLEAASPTFLTGTILPPPVVRTKPAD